MISNYPNVFMRQLWRNFSRTSRNFQKPVTPGPVVQQVVKNAPQATGLKDVLIYKYDAPHFFKFLNAFAISQYGFWLVISYCSFSFADIPVPEKKTSELEEKKDEDDLPFWRKINLGQNKWRYGISAGAAIVGFTILCVSWAYIFRSVRYLVLRKDQKTVSFVTYAPFGGNRILDVPINHISAGGSRNSGSSQIPIKVKNRRLFYLVEVKKGKFLQSQLFDKTVGTKRKF